ncbi:MAG: aspartate kinase [Polyangiaceae bacterium]|nr:aspartate kinase [Polyangiaceae bacterium]
MSTVVQKFGGSSVADLEKIRAVAAHVARTREAGHRVVVVVSAMGKTTDGLLALARDAALGPDAASTEPPRRELDMLVSTGERVSMALLAIAMHARGIESISFTGSQSGILTNDRHFDARILEVRPHRIEDELDRGRVVIVAGYQGMSYRREITTLGRGGSDTTAVALAAALGAERCEIYSDVDGVYTADPRSVAGAAHLPELDYQTMQEMAESGAKVLNAQAVEWARRNRVVLHARRTGDAANGRETIIHAGAAPTARAVVVQGKLALLRARARDLGALVRAAAEQALALGDLAVQGERVFATAPLGGVPDWQRIRAELQRATPGGLEVEEGCAAVSLVGVDTGARADVVARALGLVQGTPEWVCAHPLRLSVVVPTGDAPATERAWHDGLVAA